MGPEGTYDLSWRRVGDSAFVINRGDAPPIIYAPLQGLIMEANDSYAQRFESALSGDAASAAAIGVDPELLSRLTAIDRRVQRKLEPRYPDTFQPGALTLFLTHKCTLRCSYCYCNGGSGGDIPWPVLEAAVRYALPNAVSQKRQFNVSFHGGDVGAVWPLFVRAVEFIETAAAEAGVRPWMNLGTNGYYSPEQAEFIARHIQNATLSIDGIPAVHDAYRATATGKGSAEAVLRTARTFDEHKTPYSARMTVTAESVDSFPAGVEFICEHTNASSIRAEPMYTRGRANGSGLNPPKPEPFIRAFREAVDVASEYGMPLTYSGARLNGVYSAFCSYPAPTFGVTPEGNLTCCYEVLHEDDPLSREFFYGSIPVDGSRVDVDEERILAIRARAALARKRCSDCFCVFTCAGDCAAKGPVCGVSDEDPMRCVITRALVLDMIEAALDGNTTRLRLAEGLRCRGVEA